MELKNKTKNGYDIGDEYAEHIIDVVLYDCFCQDVRTDEPFVDIKKRDKAKLIQWIKYNLLIKSRK